VGRDSLCERTRSTWAVASTGGRSDGGGVRTGRSSAAEKAERDVFEIMRRNYRAGDESLVNAARVFQPRAATPGRVLPSIHSRKAPPALET
jgi:hypothetical protein